MGLCDRYRGTGGVLGWVVWWFDVRALKRHARAAILAKCQRQAEPNICDHCGVPWDEPNDRCAGHA